MEYASSPVEQAVTQTRMSLLGAARSMRSGMTSRSKIS